MARNKPHITLASFRPGEEAEDTLIRWIHRICQQHRSFRLALNNYSGIPPHTILPAAVAGIPGRLLAGTGPELDCAVQQLDAIDEFIRSSGWPPVLF